ncbi:TetR/AcrR family transcriptional regulator [Flavobacterium sp. NKUCC04_CG]|uniref:TetR/AcrR family transcriptional regulator n=1 Tax=Flavobacterium sp. NKUCC04_CG TaxID=2842121 RepID=UPI001C5BCBDC|nr:TetR/AcrR family transcriptional regulator [Flavobacterium sp. NKUCC04_CG]MBW3519468.1 TetR/AcrR family transcriptional regulator [Flavobacterium sp. NKUCC04_CG]
MKDTRHEIVVLADQLIRSKGFNAFSYADISKVLGLKNAAVHYHFPSKFDLGLTVIKKTIETFEVLSTSWSGLEIPEQLEQYMGIWDRTKAENCVCLMGALAPSFDTLSIDMQQALTVLGNTIIAWLSQLLEKGREAHIFNFKGSAKSQAYLIQSSLMASLLLEKVLQDDICHTITAGILKN